MLSILISKDISNKQSFIVITFAIVFVFAIIYWLLGSNDNFSFTKDQEKLTFIDALYFSMVTQTTLGYGDISPKSEIMRSISFIHLALLIIHITFANL